MDVENFKKDINKYKKQIQKKFKKEYDDKVGSLIRDAEIALSKQILLNYPDITKSNEWNLGNKKVIQIVGSQSLNAWQHAYIAGVYYLKYGKIISLSLGYGKEIITMEHLSKDTFKDIYNNYKGIQVAKKSVNIEDFEKNFLINNLNMEKITMKILNMNILLYQKVKNHF